MPPSAPRCPDVAALVRASAVVRREPSSRTRPRTSPDVLDIELAVTLPANPMQVTLAAGDPSVYGGVLVGRSLHPDPTKAVVLIRPSGTVAREGSMLAFFGVTCGAAHGSLRVEMTYALPLHDGDKVTVRRVDGS
jgi:hypothetical protein